MRYPSALEQFAGISAIQIITITYLLTYLLFTTIENDMQTQGSNRVNMPPTTPPPEAMIIFYSNLNGSDNNS